MSDHVGVVLLTTSPLSHLLDGNQAPSSLEVASLHHGITTITARMHELHAEYQHLKDQLLRHHAALAPIRRVPAEVLNEIFSFVLPFKRTFAEGEKLLTLRLVCRAWNAVSYTQWSRLQVSVNLARPFSSSQVRSWFANGRNSKKALELYLPSPLYQSCRCRNPSGTCWWANPKLAELLCDTRSLASLALGFPSPRCFENFLVALTLHTPSARETWTSLTSLTLGIWGFTKQPTRYHSLLNDVPAALKTLRLELGGLTPEAAREPPQIDIAPTPFRNLTTLSITCSWDSPFVLHALRQCVSVEDLHLNFRSGGQTWTEKVGEIVLPRVRTLVLDSIEPSVTSKVLTRLRFPSLVSFEICDFPLGRESRRTLRDVLDSLQLMSCGKHSTLRSLKVKGMKVETGALADILLNLPTLERVFLDNIPFDVGDFLAACQDSEASPSDGPARAHKTLLPSLKQLELLNIRDGFGLEPLLQFFKKRKRASKQMGSPDSLRRIVLSTAGSSGAWGKIRSKCYIVMEELRRNHGVVVDRLVPWDDDDDDD